MKKAEAYWPLILLLAVIKFVLPLFLQSPVYELQRDEYLYYEQGQHIALGYLENPPLLAWLGTISSWFGGTTAWIKLWPCLFGAATLVVACMITAELGGDRFAQFITGLGMITGAYLRVHFLFQPNILDIFCWTLAAYFLTRYINTKNHRFIYGIAFSLALGWWSKYSVLFIAAAIILGLLMTRHRVVFLKKQTWIAFAGALIIVAPNIWWQYQHNWPLLHHMDELRETQLQYLNPADYLKDQVLMLLPVAFVWITGLVWVLRSRLYRVSGYVFILVIILILAGSGKNYYTLGAYPMLIAAGSVALEKQTGKRLWARYAITALIVMLTIPLIPLLLPVKEPVKLAAFYERNGFAATRALRWEDQRDHPLPQDFADMLGWKELAAKTEAFYVSLPDTIKKQTTIFGRHYGHAGSLKFYGKDKSFRENVITDNGSFLMWIDLGKAFDHLIFIGRRLPGSDDEVFNHFQKYTIIDSVTNPLSRQFGDKIIFFENIDPEGLRIARQGLQEMKDQFSRKH